MASFARVFVAGVTLACFAGMAAAQGEPRGETGDGAGDDAPIAGATQWMSAGEIGTAFGGQNIAGHYRTGHAFTESYHIDGSLDYTDDNRHTGGHWSVRNGSFCTIYAQDPTGGCYRVRRVGSNCFEFYFIARTEEGADHPLEPSWTARGWVNGHRDTCAEGSTV